MRRLPDLLALATLLLVAAPSGAAVDAEIDLVTKLRGSIAPAGEVDGLRFLATAGTRVTLSIASKSPDLLVTAEIRSPADVTVWAGGPARRLKAAKLELLRTGSYRLLVSGAGTGEYRLKLRGKAAKSFADADLALDADGTAPFPFAAPARSTVSLKVKPLKGSAAQPRFGALGGTDLSPLGTLTATTHVVSAVVGDGGDLSVAVTNRAATAGSVSVRAKVRPPRVRKSKLDLRGVAFGLPGGGESVVSRTVAAAAGATLVVDDAESALHGAEVVIPAGALAADTRVTLRSTPDAELPESDQPAGPALEFLPTGTTFSTPVSIRMPFRESMLPLDASPAEIRVVHEHDDGTRQTIVPDEVDAVEHTVTFATTSFSRFMPTVQKGPPNLKGRSYWALALETEIRAHLDEDLARRIIVGLGSVTFGRAGAGGSYTWTENERVLALGQKQNIAAFHDWMTLDVPLEAEGTLTARTVTGRDPGVWTTEASGQHVILDDGEEHLRFAVSPDGSILLSGWEERDSDCHLIELLIEKLPSAPTRASLVGTWWIAELELDFTAPGETPLHEWLYRAFGSITLKKSGAFSSTVREFGSKLNSSSVVPAWRTERSRFTTRGDWDIAADGTVTLSFTDDGEREERRFFPGADGQLMFGSTKTLRPDGQYVAVMTRRGSGMGPATTTGKYDQILGETNPDQFALHFLQEEAAWDAMGWTGTYVSGAVMFETFVDVGHFGLDQSAERWEFDGHSSTIVASNIRDKAIRRGHDSPWTVSLDYRPVDPFPSTQAFVLSKNGRYRHTGAGGDVFVGAVTPDGQFGFGIDDPGGPIRAFGFEMFLKLPPRR